MKHFLATVFLPFLVLLTAWSLGVANQAVTAFVDRETVQLGETLKFTIKSSGPNPGITVNLEKLKKDFKVLGTSQNNQIKMYGGQTIITTEIITTLQPKRTGKLEIPSIQFGQHQTPPITCHVLPRSEPEQSESNRDQFL